MLDAIQRLRLERRYALLFSGVFLLLAVLCHWLSGGHPSTEDQAVAPRVEVRQ